jgi:hypothetical protein
MAVNRYYSSLAQDTTLTSGISSSSTSIVVAATTGFPSQTPFVLALDYNNALEELVTVTNVTGLTLTISRADAGKGSNTVGAAVAHAVGSVVRHVITAQDLTEAQSHIAATGSVHGITGPVVTFLANPTSANLLAAVTDETGSGSLVFATGPTLSGPTLSSPVITGTINASGSTGPSGTFLQSTGTGVAWASATQSTSYTLIGSTNFGTTNASTINFGSLSGYNKYMVVAGGIYSGTTGTCNFTINGDTGSNYSYTFANPAVNQGQSGYITAGTNDYNMNTSWTNINTFLSDRGANKGLILFIDGAGSTAPKTISGWAYGYQYEYPVYIPSLGMFSGVYNGTSAVTSITFNNNATATGGTVYLYGSK